MAALEKDLRRLISDFVAGQVSFGAFNLQLALETCDLPDDEPDAAMANEADLLVAEFTSGHRTMADLKEAFFKLLGDTLEIEMPLPDRSAALIRRAQSGRASNATLRPAAVCA